MRKPKPPVRNIAKPQAMSLLKLPAWLPELEKWEHAAYDGIKGCPPPWIPAPHMKQLCTARWLLFHLVRDQKESYTEIRARFDFLNKEKYGAIVLALMKDTKTYDDALNTLLRIYKAAQLGPVEGLRQLAGETAVVGYRAANGYRNRADVAVRACVQQLGKDYWATNPMATIKEIMNIPRVRSMGYADKTKREWLSKVDPRPSDHKRGRPRSHS